jgi:predicted RNA-binding Zn ribbon-like protein
MSGLAAPYRWTSIGGHLALDLCNTVSWRLDPARRVDRLTTASDLIAWFAAVTDPADRLDGASTGSGAEPGAGPVDRDRLERDASDHPEAAEKTLHEVKELRDATIRVLDHHLGLAPAAPDDAQRIADAWRQALAVAIPGDQLPWRWRIEPKRVGDLACVLALSVADLLHRPDPSRLRRCDGEGCGWLFLDSSRNRSRRWCDPLDCGNRTRVRHYVERRRGLAR